MVAALGCVRPQWYRISLEPPDSYRTLVRQVCGKSRRFETRIGWHIQKLSQFMQDSVKELDHAHHVHVDRKT